MYLTVSYAKTIQHVVNVKQDIYLMQLQMYVRYVILHANSVQTVIVQMIKCIHISINKQVVEIALILKLIVKNVRIKQHVVNVKKAIYYIRISV